MHHHLRPDQIALLATFEQALNCFFAHLDARRYDAMLAHFTNDARWFRQGKWSDGHRAIRQALEERCASRQTCHVMSNHHIASASDCEVTVQSVMTAYSFPAPANEKELPQISGPLRLNLVATVFCKQANGAWLISSQRFDPRVAFKAA